MMTKHEVQKIIENNNFSNAIFEADLCSSLGDVTEFDDLYHALPDWLVEAVDNGSLELDDMWDPEYWGSSSVVQIAIREPVGNYQSPMGQQLETWQEEHEEEYAAFCSGLEAALWEHLKKQENFEVFNAVMQGEWISTIEQLDALLERYTQTELAYKLHCDQSQVSKMLNGKIGASKPIQANIDQLYAEL